MNVKACVAIVRSGAWLSEERLRIYPALLGGALALAVVALVATSHSGIDCWHRPLGVDFSGIWVAGDAVRNGHPAQPYDNAAHAAAQVRAFGPSDTYLPWPYPPYFLGVAALLAGLPYLAALALWQGGTLLLYVAAVLQGMRGTTLGRRDILVTALAFPAVAVNLVHGQNGLLSAGLLGLGALLLPRRPLIAGLLLGLLVYKPQFAIAVPCAILAGGFWRAGLASLAAVVILTLATFLAFGFAPWHGFLDNLAFTRHVILETGGLESWKLQSAFAAVRLRGGSVQLAYVAQGAVTLAVLVALGRLWHGHADHRLKAAGLIVATLLTTPYSVDYDMTILGPALAAFVGLGLTRGFGPWDKSILAAAWAMPLVARVSAMALDLPVGFLITGALMGAILRHAEAGRVSVPRAAAITPV